MVAASLCVYGMFAMKMDLTESNNENDCLSSACTT